jgi:cellulose synthase/poly-beta-1,6-N-acetylglucosamine synthase-like glycosyltransferase
VIVLLILLSLIALLWLFFFLSPAHKLFFKIPLDSTTPLPDPAAWPTVTIIVPARNEANMLPRTLPTICQQDYPHYNVIVVDDQSDDATPAILQQLAQQFPHLTTIRAPDRPPGWCGKPWAVTQAVRHPAAATADLLLFTDADIDYHPTALRQAIRLLESVPYDCLSLFPQLHFNSLSEKIGLTGFVTLLALGYPAGVVNDPKRKEALAAGAFILVRRAPYQAIGGHESVKNQVIEDLNLARNLKKSGARMHIRLTRDLVSTQMYENFSDMWEGLSKNALAAADYQAYKFLLGLPIVLAVAVFPPLYLFTSLAIALITWPATAKLWLIVALSALICALISLIHRRTIIHLRLAAPHALLFSASLALYLFIVAGSWYQHRFHGGNLWKGRRYHRDALTPTKS